MQKGRGAHNGNKSKSLSHSGQGKKKENKPWYPSAKGDKEKIATGKRYPERGEEGKVGLGNKVQNRKEGQKK